MACVWSVVLQMGSETGVWKATTRKTSELPNVSLALFWDPDPVLQRSGKKQEPRSALGYPAEAGSCFKLSSNQSLTAAIPAQVVSAVLRGEMGWELTWLLKIAHGSGSSEPGPGPGRVPLELSPKEMLLVLHTAVIAAALLPHSNQGCMWPNVCFLDKNQNLKPAAVEKGQEYTFCNTEGLLGWTLGPVLLTDASVWCWADAQLCQWDWGSCTWFIQERSVQK